MYPSGGLIFKLRILNAVIVNHVLLVFAAIDFAANTSTRQPTRPYRSCLLVIPQMPKRSMYMLLGRMPGRKTGLIRGLCLSNMALEANYPKQALRACSRIPFWQSPGAFL